MTAVTTGYPARFARVYDDRYVHDLGDVEAMCSFIARKAPGGSVLEYGVGTGRLAVPLARRGLQVTGVDNCEAMLAVLHGKLAAESSELPLTIRRADFLREAPIGPGFDCVLIANNTALVATNLDEQVKLFAGALESLAPGGIVIIECSNPMRLHAQQERRTEVEYPSGDCLIVESYDVDPATQLVSVRRTLLDGGPPETVRHIVRYVFPSELDAIARCAGAVRCERMATWSGAPFVRDEPRFISVYTRG